MNNRCELITIGDTVIPGIDVFRYAKKKGIPTETVCISQFTDLDVLSHWSEYYIEYKNTLFYKNLSMMKLVEIIERLNNIDLDHSLPIIIHNDVVIDGLHRILAHFLKRRMSIKAIRLTDADIQQIINEH